MEEDDPIHHEIDESLVQQVAETKQHALLKSRGGDNEGSGSEDENGGNEPDRPFGLLPDWVAASLPPVNKAIENRDCITRNLQVYVVSNNKPMMFCPPKGDHGTIIKYQCHQCYRNQTETGFINVGRKKVHVGPTKIQMLQGTYDVRESVQCDCVLSPAPFADWLERGKCK